MDDLERQLRDLGERVDRSLHDEPVLPRIDVRKRSRKRRTGAILTSSLVTVGLVAAGVVGARSLGGRRAGTPVGSGVLASAADATEAQETALFEFEMTMRMESSGMDRDVDAKGVGQADFANDRTYMTLEGVDEAFGGSETVEMIQDGDVAYSRSDGDDKWLRTELPGGFNSQQQFRPDDYLDYLRDVSLSVERIGDEEIDGVAVTRYRAYMDIERLAEQAGEEAQEALESFEYSMEPSDVWIDAEGLVRRMTFGTSFSGGLDESMEMEMSAVISFHDFGAPVEITIPDKSEVTEIEVGEDSGGSASATTSESVELTEGEPADSESTILLMTSNDLDGLTGEVFGSFMCVFRAPEWATRVDLMVDGRPVASFGEKELEEPDDGTPRECQWVADIRDEIREGNSLIFRVTSASRTSEFRIVEIREL